LPAVLRAKEIDAWARSPDYTKLLTKNRQYLVHSLETPPSSAPTAGN
jgi:hypothetical protein